MTTVGAGSSQPLYATVGAGLSQLCMATVGAGFSRPLDCLNAAATSNDYFLRDDRPDDRDPAFEEERDREPELDLRALRPRDERVFVAPTAFAA